MTELIADLCIPSELIIPTINVRANQPTVSGALFMSGAKLYVRGASLPELITSTAS